MGSCARKMNTVETTVSPCQPLCMQSYAHIELTHTPFNSLMFPLHLILANSTIADKFIHHTLLYASSYMQQLINELRNKLSLRISHMRNQSTNHYFSLLPQILSCSVLFSWQVLILYFCYSHLEQLLSIFTDRTVIFRRASQAETEASKEKFQRGHAPCVRW